MGVNFKAEVTTAITAAEVKEGQIVEIVHCSFKQEHCGKILLRYRDNVFINISGEHVGETFYNLPQTTNSKDFLVRVLKNGEELIITENE